MNIDGMVPVEILLVEDHVPDQRLTQRAFSKSNLKNNLHIAIDGVDALAFLRKGEGYEKSPTPHLILLDLNMPRMDGRELLKIIKQDPVLRKIPVVVLTTSSDDRDILSSYDLYANAYIVKPVSFTKFTEAIQAIEDHWFLVVRVPGR